jgi:hypothetical protein
LKNQEIQVTSQFCEDEFHYLEEYGLTTGEDEGYFKLLVDKKVNCLTNTETNVNGFGPFGFHSDKFDFNNDCLNWITMPKEPFMIKTDPISSFELSKNL